MKKSFNKGFTLIELLVVIAIIGILASVILASLNSARAKGTDAAIKSDFSNARAQAELYYDNNVNSYANVCITAVSPTNGILGMIQDAAKKGGYTVAAHNSGPSAPTIVACNDSATGWAASAPLKSPSPLLYFCIDSTGQTTQDANPLPAGVTLCP